MEGFQVPGTFSPAFFLSGRAMREPSIFVEESGSDGLFDRCCLLTVVMHDQSDSIAESLHRAVEYALSKDAVVYRSAQPSEYRLSQVADYICTMELTAIKYAEHAATATDEKFFGKWSDFKKGILKETRKKLV